MFIIDGISEAGVRVNAKAGRTHTSLSCTNLIFNVWNDVDMQAVSSDGSISLIDTNGIPEGMYKVEVVK